MGQSWPDLISIARVNDKLIVVLRLHHASEGGRGASIHGGRENKTS